MFLSFGFSPSLCFDSAAVHAVGAEWGFRLYVDLRGGMCSDFHSRDRGIYHWVVVTRFFFSWHSICGCDPGFRYLSKLQIIEYHTWTHRAEPGLNVNRIYISKMTSPPPRLQPPEPDPQSQSWPCISFPPRLVASTGTTYSGSIAATSEFTARLSASESNLFKSAQWSGFSPPPGS